MKDYKRFTTRNEKGEWTIELNEGLKLLQCNLPADAFVSVLFDLIAQRLCDLEDKIEDGTLVELPCKVGDTIYWISSNNRDIIEVVVNRIAFVEHDRKIFYVAEKGVGEYSIMFIDDIYTTKAKAEAKLRELKEKENADKD